MGIKEEVKEIYEEMKEDFRKGKEYAYQYRKTIFWIFITFIAMQFTNVLSLGASWQNMCEHNPDLQLKKVQKGGAEENAAQKAINAQLKFLENQQKNQEAEKNPGNAKAAGGDAKGDADAKTAAGIKHYEKILQSDKSSPQAKKAAGKFLEALRMPSGDDAAKSTGGDAATKPTGGDAAAKAKPTGGDAAAKAAGGDAAKAAGGDAAAEKAAYNKGKSVVEAEKKAKAEARAAKAARKSGLRSFKPFQGLKRLGPISGFFSKIGGYLKGGFFIIGIIIAILVVSVIPILIFSTLMYYIIKFLTKKVSRL